MVADASIYGLIRPYDAGPGPLETYGKVAQIRNLMGQGQLQDLHTEKLSRDLSEEQQVRELFRKYPDGKVPIGELFAASPTHALTFQKSALDIEKAKGDIGKTSLESQALQLKQIRDIAAQVSSDADMPAAREAAARVVGPDRVGQLPFFNAPFTPENKLRAITTADEHFKQLEAQRGRDVTLAGQAETARHNVATEEQGKFSAPIEATGADGRPVMAVQDRRTGALFDASTRAPLQGLTPKLNQPSPPTVGQMAMVQSAKTDLENYEKLLFPGDKFDRSMIYRTNVPFAAGMPGDTKARQAYSALNNAIAAKLRLETGAQANDQEIEEIAKRFRPNVGDTEASARDKVGRLKQFMDTTLQMTRATPGAASAPKPSGPNPSSLSNDELLRELSK